MYLLLREPFLSGPGLFYALAVDFLIVFFVIINIIRGYKIGFLRQLFGFAGFIVGMFLGVLLVPWMVATTTDRFTRTIITFGVVLAAGAFIAWVVELIAKDVRKLKWRLNVRRADNIFGALTGGLMALIGTWLVVAMFTSSSLAPLATGLQGSLVMRGLDMIMPPAPTIVTHVQVIIDPGSVPQIFVGLEPWPAMVMDSETQVEVTQAVSLAGDSVVQVESLGCGGLYGGSGFVVGDQAIATNAHVVAGIKRPVIVDKHGPHITTPIHFDPVNDVAILKASNLAGRALELSRLSYPRGAKVTVMGYPNGGPFEAMPGAVLEQDLIKGRDIYDRDEAIRNIYTIQSNVRPGSSGSPMVLPDGTVSGMVYGRSLLADGIGYALASTELRRIVDGLNSNAKSVSTGSCTGN